MEKYPVTAGEGEHHLGLTADEWEFLEDYGTRLDSLLEAVVQRSDTNLRGLIRSLFRKDTWRVIFERERARRLIDKHVSARSDNEGLTGEFGQRIETVDVALENLAEFMERLHKGSGSR